MNLLSNNKGDLNKFLKNAIIVSHATVALSERSQPSSRISQLVGDVFKHVLMPYVQGFHFPIEPLVLLSPLHLRQSEYYNFRRENNQKLIQNYKIDINSFEKLRDDIKAAHEVFLSDASLQTFAKHTQKEIKAYQFREGEQAAYNELIEKMMVASALLLRKYNLDLGIYGPACDSFLVASINHVFELTMKSVFSYEEETSEEYYRNRCKLYLDFESFSLYRKAHLNKLLASLYEGK